ncbi:hypothetical protein HYY75_11940 [bacterium]|nr:hypothetical protein [bacterium]
MQFLSQKIEIFFAVLLVLLPFKGELAIAYEDIMPIKDIKIGMKGIGKTVIHGNEIETFNIEIMGILSNNKINDNLLINGNSILVKVSGKVIEEAGGIAAGMSGSPIYINGKLIGGLSSGWVMTDHSVGLVTPIEEMMEIWDYPLSKLNPYEEEPIRWVSANGILLNRQQVFHVWEIQDFSQLSKIPERDVVFFHAATPVFLQGLSEKAAAILGSKLRLKKIQTAPSFSSILNPNMSSSSRGTTPVAVEPGSAIGVQLARGDINVTTIGTLTYKEGKRILAFAHSFLKRGRVSFCMTGAHIYHSFSSVQMPFKIGAPTELIGTITQDREKGLAGELGVQAPMVPVHIDITDKDLKKTKSLHFQVVRDSEVFKSVIESTLLQGIEGVIDRTGPGTALMGVATEFSNLSGLKSTLRREDLFYSSTDIVEVLIDEITELYSKIGENEFMSVVPNELLLKIEIEQKRRTLTIEKVEVKNASITPGGILEVWVTLRPFREKPIVQKAKLVVPQNIGREDLKLTVFGVTSRSEGDAHQNSTEEKTSKSFRDLKPEEPGKTSLSQLVGDLAEGPKNSDLLFQFSIEGDEEKKLKINGNDFEKQPTSGVVIGNIETTITLSEE